MVFYLPSTLSPTVSTGTCSTISNRVIVMGVAGSHGSQAPACGIVHKQAGNSDWAHPCSSLGTSIPREGRVVPFLRTRYSNDVATKLLVAVTIENAERRRVTSPQGRPTGNMRRKSISTTAARLRFLWLVMHTNKLLEVVEVDFYHLQLVSLAPH